MKKYFVKSPWWLQKIYTSYTWKINTTEKIIYLTFDDGPHPEVTPFVLDVLQTYQAKATFFCIGKNVAAFPGIYNDIVKAGHTVGNHTYHHLNGWKTDNATYLEDVRKAAEYINSPLFRPPYGRIRKGQAKLVQTATSNRNLKTVMWDVLSADFDQSLTGEVCTRYVTRLAGKGSIVVFHDSAKAYDRLKLCLPATLRFFAEKGFFFQGIPLSV